MSMLDTHPNDPNRDIYLKKYQAIKIVLGRIFKIVTFPKENITPVHAEKIEEWENYIANFFNTTSKPKPAIPQSLPSLPPQIHKPRVRPMEDVRNVKSQPAQNPTSISPSPVLVECNDVDTNLRNNTSEQTSTNQSPIERLLKGVSSISPQALKSGIDDIFSVTSMGDVMDSATPW
ncbi:putative mediator of RNA polymerase II transcription subunit 15b [Silene latifolia]|uniref:putative mediator of RNA polymerase II transcription subunit 15b n=1 Tax=Silene latifolia TaxID=37657 RepID=UPI003D76C51C